MQSKDVINQLSTELLIDAYRTAVRLGLGQEFITLLKSELARRDIDINQ